MRIISLAVLAGLCILPAAKATAQQCGQTQAQLLRCGGYQCSQEVAVNIVVSSPYPVFLESFKVYCCSTDFDSYTPSGGICGPEVIRNPSIQMNVAKLASTQVQLVATCEGNFVQYQTGPKPTEEDGQFFRAPKIWAGL